jgi:putative nucleotidyltransferase with HDIG domain
MKIVVPEEVVAVSYALAEAGFEAYLVGGCVRDILLDREPKDWDVATDAKPEEVQKLFPESVYENDFGTVGVKTASEDPRLKIIEVTTYRIEGKYTDQRHPDEVKFTAHIEDDLARRDFTVNAMAMGMLGDIVDPFGGARDIKDRIVRTVGVPKERFSEDALRLMRAVRFSTELDFEIEMNTRRAIVALAGGLEAIAKERVRDELTKIIMTPNAAQGIILLEELDLLRYILPELREGIGVGQNKHHIYTVFEHNVRALDYAARENYSLAVRMASLLHDVGKPKVKGGDGLDSTFYQHEYVGARMAVKILDRLRYSKDFVEQVAHLVRMHMFNYETGVISPAGVRRFVVRVGPENIDDLLKVREADRIGSGVKKAVPYRLRHLLFMVEKVKRDPLSPKMLALRGDDLMPLLGIPQSRRVGWILNALMEEVIDDPEKNEKKYLETRAKELNTLSDAELQELFASAQRKKRAAEGEMDEDIKKKHHVQ